MSGDDEGLPLVQEPSSADLEAGLSAERPATPHDGAAPASPAAAGPLPSDAAMAAATALERDGGSGLASLTRWMEQNVPFLVLLAIVFVYEHWGGLLTFAYLTVGLHFANVRMKEQVGLKEKRSRPELLLLLAVLLGMVGATLALFAEEELWLRLAFVTPSRGQPPAQQTILRVVWCVVVTDLVARYLSMAAKAALALCLCATPPRRLRQLYRLSEMCAAVYRSALPVPAWYGWLLLDGSGSLFPSLVTGLYLTFKMAAVLDQLRTLSSACRAALTHQSLYGHYATENEVGEVASDESCSICHDEMSAPVVLSCKHVFCEECVCEWLERERTCPLCRAVVSSGPSYQSDGTGPLMCQIF